MKSFNIAALCLLSLCALRAAAECKVTEVTRKFEGAEGPIVTLENDRIILEIAPDRNGKIFHFAEKGKALTPFEFLDDCPYHFGCRWEGKPFTYRVDSKGPDHAAVTVIGGGKIAVSNLRVLGFNLTNPLDVTVERTMSIESGSTRVHVDVKITNTGDGIAPAFRYMVHSVYGGEIAREPIVWFLPTKSKIEVFDSARGGAEMWTCASGAPLDHPFSRFFPGRHAEKPRYEIGGWGAVLTSAGPTYIYYDPSQYDFMQYWYGGDALWHFTFEPETKPIDLKPKQSMTCSFTLAYDSADVPFSSETIAYRTPVVSAEVVPGGNVSLKCAATTVRDKNEHAAISFSIKDPQAKVVLTKDIAADVKPFVFSELSLEGALPAASPLGKYTWEVRNATAILGTGSIEVLDAAAAEQRKVDRLTADLNKKLEETRAQFNAVQNVQQQDSALWTSSMNMALSFDSAEAWPARTPPRSSIEILKAATPVLGHWMETEDIRIKEMKLASAAMPADAIEQMLALLKDDRAFIRDIACDPDGKGLAVLLVDPAKTRCEALRINATGIVKHVAHYAEKPAETDDTIGIGARAIAVDKDGNLWIATNAWGPTSVFEMHVDGSPHEISKVSDKGAVKKFTRDGVFAGGVGLLDAPIDLAVAEINGMPAVLASYRQVSTYHGAQTHEGTMVIRASDAKRVADIKGSGGAFTIDSQGRAWVADVAGHVSCTDARGTKFFEVAESPDAAVLDAKLPLGSPLPGIVRADGKDTIWLLFTLQRKLVALGYDGKSKATLEIPVEPGELSRLIISESGPVVVGDKANWKPK